MSKLDESLLPVYNKVLRFLATRPRSKGEILSYLKKKEVSSEHMDTIIGLLTEQKYLNDIAFAQWFIEQRNHFRPKPMRVLKLELQQKGLSTEVISQALGEVGVDEVAHARLLAEKKKPSLRSQSSKVRRQKIAQFLARRGFSWEVISQVIPEEF